jgi:serine carboxypeptidase-like clade 1
MQGYIVGNPFTGDKIDANSKVMFSHSFGIISDQQYEVYILVPSHIYAFLRNAAP